MAVGDRVSEEEVVPSPLLQVGMLWPSALQLLLHALCTRESVTVDPAVPRKRPSTAWLLRDSTGIPSVGENVVVVYTLIHLFLLVQSRNVCTPARLQIELVLC